jgi:cytoskeletal protein CcmA (bactofilin family)
VQKWKRNALFIANQGKAAIDDVPRLRRAHGIENRGHDMSDSVFADDLQIKGSVNTKGNIKLNGVVEGDVSARTLLIKEKAELRGSATTEKVVVGGYVGGNIDSVRVDLTSSAKVQGDLVCKTVSVDEEAHYSKISKHIEDQLKDGR